MVSIGELFTKQPRIIISSNCFPLLQTENEVTYAANLVLLISRNLEAICEVFNYMMEVGLRHK